MVESWEGWWIGGLVVVSALRPPLAAGLAFPRETKGKSWKIRQHDNAHWADGSCPCVSCLPIGIDGPQNRPSDEARGARRRLGTLSYRTLDGGDAWRCCTYAGFDFGPCLL